MTTSTRNLTIAGQALIFASVPIVFLTILDFPLWARIIGIVVQIAMIATGSALLGAALKRSRYGQES